MATNNQPDFTPEAVNDGDTEAAEGAMAEFRALAHDPQNYL